VEVDGVEVLNTLGDFQQEGTTGWNNMYIENSPGLTSYVDDTCFRTSAQGKVALADELFMSIRFPDGDDTTAFTRSAGSANYETIDENPPSDSDYNESTTAGEQDIFDWPALDWSPTYIDGVTQYMQCSRDGSITTLETITVSGVTTDYGTAQSPAAAGVTGVTSENIDQDPNTAADWTEANLNSAQFGYEDN